MSEGRACGERCSERVARLEQKLSDVEARLSKVESALFSNGVMTRLARLEEKTSEIARVQKAVMFTTVATFVTILVSIIMLVLR